MRTQRRGSPNVDHYLGEAAQQRDPAFAKGVGGGHRGEAATAPAVQPLQQRPMLHPCALKQQDEQLPTAQRMRNTSRGNRKSKCSCKCTAARAAPERAEAVFAAD